jgi:hypothetical protein
MQAVRDSALAPAASTKLCESAGPAIWYRSLPDSTDAPALKFHSFDPCSNPPFEAKKYCAGSSHRENAALVSRLVHGNAEPNANALGTPAAHTEATRTTNTAGTRAQRRTKRRIPTRDVRVSVSDEQPAMAKLLGSK